MAPPRSATERYIVEEQLASGGMGVVYRVRDRVTGELRALKRVNPSGAHHSYYLKAFEREYQVLASLQHPRIIRVFDYGVDDLGPFYTMELLEGQDLRSSAPLPYSTACTYIRDVATSLALLHARRLLHRDLSPTNVRMTGDGHCKLLDFGALAAFGYTSHVVGTPPLVPPEAFDGSSLDQRSDLYSLGALAYFLLTGRHAFPARDMDQLAGLWGQPIPPPSALVHGIPEALDSLVLSMLSTDPRARPVIAAEVIARLTVIAELPPEDSSEVERLAQSFLASPRFIGRATELRRVHELVQGVSTGHGGAIRIEAVAGMGRTRLLEEIGMGGQMAGLAVIRADAGMQGTLYGTARALALRVFDVLPEVAIDCAAGFRPALAALGREVEARLEKRSTPSPDEPGAGQENSKPLEEWFAMISRRRPLVIAVDNIEYADDASLGILAALAKASAGHPIVVVVSERISNEKRLSLGLKALRTHAQHLHLPGLSGAEMLELVRSLFGDAPNAERFADWLHGRTAGSPLHAVEISRQLVAGNVIRYAGGLWTLPVQRPETELPAALGDALSFRIGSLSVPARSLAESLSLGREKPTLELCCLLAGADERRATALLDELARNDVLYAEGDSYRFSSAALRDALLAGMGELGLESSHRRLGEALSKLASARDPALMIEAGWHLIQGGDEHRGADLIAAVTHDAVTIRLLHANLHYCGAALEAALHVYRRHRKSTYRRMPLLAALAQAGYYEERSWGELYGDEALDVLEDISGLRTARRLRPFCGRWISLLFGIFFAVVRFALTPRAERKYSFAQVLVQLMSVVTTLSGAASLSLDSDRAERVADTLEPFSVLPEKLTPVGIYQFCRGLGEIGRDNEPVAYETFDRLLSRFQDPRYYPTLPADARRLYVAAAHFARASFAIFRADGRGALESADALDRMGLKLYAMIASQLRFLYYMNRGEFAKAAVHRDRVELQAAQVGSIWQVETWQAAALILVHTTLNDIVGSTHVAHRLELLSKTVPSLKLHARLAQNALLLSRHEKSYIDQVADDYKSHVPRSYIGWGATMAFLARGYNERGRHTEAKAVCEGAATYITDADREYVSHFLLLDLEFASAEAGLGHTAEALQRIDRLVERFRSTEHPLALGMLHETRARVSWRAGNVEDYERSLKEVERWYGSTGTPFLIAKSRRLAALRPTPGPKPPRANIPLPTQDDISTTKTASAARQMQTREDGGTA